MTSAPSGTDQTTVGAGTQSNFSKEPKDHSLVVEDIVLESDLLDMDKIKNSITFE